MRTVGLITEYNPFHNGHLHHLRESRRAAGAEVAVAVMSGHFLQRGEPALVDKWVRTEMALAAGVDVVVELPFPFACNSAPHFALGAVQTLDALGGVDALCFGSEAGELDELDRCALLLLEREGEVAARTSALLRAGVNYPAARAWVFAELTGSAAEVLGAPNNILGIEYLKALRRLGSPMQACTVRRLGAGYHDLEAAGGIASATGIRRMLTEGRVVEAFIPAASFAPFQRALSEGRCLDPAPLHRLLLARIFRGRESLIGIYQLEHGLEGRLLEAADTAASYAELTDAVKVRQLTRTRVQRLLAYVLTEAMAEEMGAFLQSGPLYLRLLGVSTRGRSFLAAGRKRRTLPLVTNFSRVYPTLKRFYGAGTGRFRLAERMLDLELRATRTYTLLMQRWGEGSRNREFYEEVRRW